MWEDQVEAAEVSPAAVALAAAVSAAASVGKHSKNTRPEGSIL